MKLTLDLKATLSQTLTPQQIQYLKLLQLPVAQLEQQMRQELEQNPMLEETTYEDNSFEESYEEPYSSPQTESDIHDTQEEYSTTSGSGDYETPGSSMIDDHVDPFEFYKLMWQDDGEIGGKGKNRSDFDDDYETNILKENITFIDDLIQQLKMIPLTDEEYMLGEQIIGNVDGDGYLRRNLQDIIDETNIFIAETNFDTEIKLKDLKQENVYNNNFVNPARQYAVSMDLNDILNTGEENTNGNGKSNGHDVNKLLETYNLKFYTPLTTEQGEKVLKHIQNLDPPGVASRSVRECLIAQCKAIPSQGPAQKLAIEILEEAYEPFAMKHYHIIKKQFDVDDQELRDALEVIRRLNPKPGSGESHVGLHTVIPDFIIERDEESNELMISINDSRLPAIHLSKAYEKLRKEAKYKQFNKDTRDWIKNKYEDAKFLIQAIRQRKSTMLKVMTAIVGLQKDFFDYGPTALRPLIYKDVSDKTGMDISTVCRIVNNKYVQTEFGTFELKYFFSESLTTEDGDEISTTVIKQILKDVIGEEPKGKPYSDDKLSAELKKRGYNVARRTVAKYREQLKIPVARLRKEL